MTSVQLKKLIWIYITGMDVGKGMQENSIAKNVYIFSNKIIQL